MLSTPRLDVLIYAHDGRGLGHASRSIGVGMALRRLFPELKVLFVSGCRVSQDLIGVAPLDWLKLPSYETEVVDGKSVGIVGKSKFSDADLGRLRSKELAHLVTLYRPRLVLVDHTPQGKHKELVAALSVAEEDTRWVLGVRGVVGAVPQARSELAGRLFRDYYQTLFWYGDSAVLGSSHCEQLQQQYGTVPVECGYVLRLSEFSYWTTSSGRTQKTLAGTISIPWLGERTMEFLRVLSLVLARVPESFGHWLLFVDTETSAAGQNVRKLFGPLVNCQIEAPGSKYILALLQSKSAIIYGGYNSLMDVVSAGVPAVVVLREMQDEEQQVHLEKLKRVAGGSLSTVSESRVSEELLLDRLLINLQTKESPAVPLHTDGAATAASHIRNLLN